MQKSKMAVWGGLTNTCEKKRSEKHLPIYPARGPASLPTLHPSVHPDLFVRFWRCLPKSGWMSWE